MPPIILRADDHRVMPWKNGGGSTTEIAVAPDDAGLDDFDWRVSMAVVAADGPFSAFPGIDRTLAVLAGAGLVLDGLTGGPARLERATPPFEFPADASVAATLIDGPITDLNVMTRRGRFRSRVRRIATDGRLELAPGTTVALLVAGKPCRLAIDGLSPIDLGNRDTARIDGQVGRLALTAGGSGDDIEAYLIELATDA